MQKLSKHILILPLALAAILVGSLYFANELGTAELAPSPVADLALPFSYTFDVDGVLHESSAPNESSSPYWWLNSGGIMTLEHGIGKTLQGDLEVGSKWQRAYSQANARDTENGLRPQNIFRLLTRTAWKDVSTSVVYTIRHYNLSISPERFESNGILLFNRYQDDNNLYYAGVRVDGTAIIKKKRDSVYHTLAQEPVIPGSYHRETNPNLLPLDTPIALKTETKNNGNTVKITLYIDIGNTGVWTEAVSVIDDGTLGGAAFAHEGSAGLRTDFMDVEFDDFRLESL